MKISIIVPIGRPESAGQTVASIVRQSPSASAVELILVGAGMAALRAQFPGQGIHYVELQGRLNPAATRIAGVAQAGGDWFLFVDDDIELAPDFLERLEMMISVAPQAGAIGARLPGRDGTYFSRVTDLANFWSQQCPRSGERDWLYSAVLAMPRQVYEEVGGFDPELAIGEDVDLTRRIRKAGYRVLYRADLVGVHNHRRTTLSRALAYSWQNGGLALAKFQENPQERPWNAGAVLHTLVLSLAGTLRANGDSLAFYRYLPGIMVFYLVFALSLERQRQRCLFSLLRDRQARGEPGRGLLGKHLASAIRGRKLRAMLYYLLAVLGENVWLFVGLGLLFLLVIRACASA